MSTDEDDVRFFFKYPDRKAHIREPRKDLVIDKQRAANYVDECQKEFWSLGPHEKKRRRILLWRIPPDNPFYDPARPGILKIPFLAFADETIEDRDDILLPLIHEIMVNAR